MQDTWVRSLGWFPWVGSPGEEHGNPLQYSCLENPMDREAWQATVHGVPKSQTWLKWLSTHPVYYIGLESSLLKIDGLCLPLACPLLSHLFSKQGPPKMTLGASSGLHGQRQGWDWRPFSFLQGEDAHELKVPQTQGPPLPKPATHRLSYFPCSGQLDFPNSANHCIQWTCRPFFLPLMKWFSRACVLSHFEW